MLRLVLIAALLPALIAWRPIAAQELTPEMVRDSIARGVNYLKKEQHPRQGSWVDYNSTHKGGVTALCTLALLSSGVKKDDPAIQKALVSLRDVGLPRGSTYATAVQTMALAAADPDRDRLLIERNARYLEAIQVRDGPGKGGWGYGDASVSSDNSNSQFALLALYEAERVGVKVSEQTWRLAMNYWIKEQQPSGAWAYQPGDKNTTGSMTCAGIASMIIAADTLQTGEAEVTGDAVRCCGQQSEVEAIAKGFDWLNRHFRVDSNPSRLSGLVGQDVSFKLYYLYALERVGRLSGRRFIGGSDWYRAGASELIELQDNVSGFWKGNGPGESEKRIGTAMALLFLAKGRRPVVVARLEHGEDDDWNHHRSAMQNLTRDVERRWQQDMTWQTVDIRAATAEDLLQTPVLFISGSQPLNFTAEQKQNLKRYVNEGGFIFAEAACGSAAFDRTFRELMAELFPDSRMRVLPPDHPVFYAEERVNYNVRELWGVDACCRTSVVYCPEQGANKSLSCYWELNRGRASAKYSDVVQSEIKAVSAIGANVLAYATNRELKDKLETPAFSLADEQTLDRRTTLVVAKINHAGGADDAPNALANLLRHYDDQTSGTASGRSPLLAASDPRLMQHPIAFMHGRRNFRFSVTERKALAEYIERGGFFFADSICGSDAFARAFREEMAAIFPDHPLERIPVEHPIFSDRYRGHLIETAEVRDPQATGGEGGLTAAIRQVKPLLEGIQIEGRYVVIFSPYDLSCALENSTSAECEGYTRADAYRIGMNVLLYGLQE